MENYTPTPFDQITATEESQFLKALIPYLPANTQRFLSLYAKMNEISHTVNLFSHHNESLQICETPASLQDPFSILNEIRPYLGEHTRQQIEQFSQLFSFIQSMNLMSDLEKKKGEPNESK